MSIEKPLTKIRLLCDSCHVRHDVDAVESHIKELEESLESSKELLIDARNTIRGHEHNDPVLVKVEADIDEFLANW